MLDARLCTVPIHSGGPVLEFHALRGPYLRRGKLQDFRLPSVAVITLAVVMRILVKIP